MNDPGNPRTATPRRDRGPIPLAVAVALTLVAAACGNSDNDDDRSASTTTATIAETSIDDNENVEPTSTTQPPSELESLEVVDRFDAGRQLWSPTLIGDELWVPRIGGVTVIDIDDGSTTFLDFEGAAETPLFAAGRVWVPNLEVPTLTVFDPDTKDIRATVTVGEAGFIPVSLGGYVWVANRNDATVSRIDMGTFDELVVELSPGFATLEVVDGNIETRATDAYWRIDLDGTATQVADPGPLPVELNGEVFRVAEDRTTLVRASDQEEEAEASIPVGSEIRQLTVTGDWIWARTVDGFVRVDPETGTADDPIPVNANGGYVGSDTGLWIATRGEDDGEVTFIQSATGNLATVALEGRPDTPTVVDDGAYVSLVFNSRREEVVQIEPVFATGS